MMPASYTIETLPIPDDSSITLRKVPARRVAAVRYSGFWSEKRFLRYKQELENWIKDNNLKIIGDGEKLMEHLLKIERNSVDVIFLDLNMPEIDGFSFLKNFKDLPEKIKLKSKIVVLTSSNSSKDREQAFSFKNVIQFITKPLKQADIEELKKLITANGLATP